MQLTEDEATEVKTWVVKKLEDISDADSDVLADYVLALIRSDAPDDEIRKASVENLEDFLREHTTQFVEELFATFATQPKAPPPVSQPQPQPQHPNDLPQSVSGPQQAFSYPATSGPAADGYGAQMGGVPQSHPGPDSSNFNRKRTFQEGFQMDQDREDVPQNRNFKTPRRGRGGGRGDWMGRDSRAAHGAPGQFPPPGAGFPVMPPSFPGFDQNDPMAAMMALQSMGFPQMPGMPPMPMAPGGPGQPQEQMGPKSSERCPFYETQGICYLGAACPYQHDAGPGASNADEYDPKSANIMMDFQRREPGPMRGSDRGRGRGRGGDRGGFGGRGRRSEFSAAGPSDDPSIKTIVVEQIPDDKLDEASVREFFSQYGEIADISLQPQRKLALITFDNHAEAKRAWSSPKVIFDNRFVKVYWHKPRAERNGDQRPSGDAMDESPAFDPEGFQRQQEEAQKAYEEKMKKRKETEEAKQKLEKQREELLKKQHEEKQRLLERLGASAGSNGADSADETAPSPVDENASEQTKQLRAQLAALEAEAKTLGIDPSQEAGGYRGRGRGYAGYRGGYVPRGRGQAPPFRGGYRGRGAARGRGGVLRLDNRPKRVAVAGVELNSEKDEALRQFLIGAGEYESIEPHPDQPNSVVVAFKERYQAEKFMFGPWNIPSVGEVQLTWVPNPPISVSMPTAASDAKTASDEDTVMESAAGSGLAVEQRKDGNHDVDYDVAEMDDNWGE
ncbi:CCCH zinc finger and RRM domain protein [Aspergillus clavatus NRRL 1]|uniref:CCCH zinc finger and RRM domain protein n=1 Tax=Aspergillus clavatus (strain ATCC 1007 / CBS 513.65 / DSM 816 / NCTC 3887 / NRRL 1 / QM 1276 / 107) TaxID=344612 RepID=A1C7J7_ASPCL|nr:CCCH zinc finger and RRM domain protein [Aspergillus clavatus NRRL 1]EAW14368.1 CCCH zinc finger and RRM domain protein [Aspergillus clavatus NRRL 1]